MKFKDLNIYGEAAVKYDLFVNKYGLFKRYYDVFIHSALIGFYRNEYSEIKQVTSDQMITIKQQIFINNAEAEDIFNAIVINHLSERQCENYLKQIIDEDYSLDENLQKFEIVKNYSLVGLNYLFESIIGEETDKNMIFNNFVDFFNDYEKHIKLKDDLISTLDNYL